MRPSGSQRMTAALVGIMMRMMTAGAMIALKKAAQKTDIDLA